ncbi:MAG: copper amine oxidase N-terminal domain-containing protein [Clostridia bacterium]|nr:copper amine oxidase N-terminal domain-containing protein [Clostridia bacterium]MDH7571972.1 copper amine oxidase N-terminal domain-containing protein [Clostridia bacterium]
MSTRRWLAVVLSAGVVLGGFWCYGRGLAQTPAPGSESDPLISRSYLETYVAERCGSLEAQIAQLTARVSLLEQQVKALREGSGGGAATGQTLILRVGSRTAQLGGETRTLEQAPYLQGNTVMVPFRFIGEALGARVSWEAQSKRIVYQSGGVKLVFQLGQPWVEVNGQRRELEVAPRLVGTTTMVPLRVVAEYLGAEVVWNQERKEITISLS